MYRKKKKLICYLMTLLLFFCIDLSFPQKAETIQAASNGSKIHFLTLQDNTDAIYLNATVSLVWWIQEKIVITHPVKIPDIHFGKAPLREKALREKSFHTCIPLVSQKIILNFI